MDPGRVDDEAEHAGVEGLLGRFRGGLGCGDAQVGGRVERAAVGVREEGVGGDAVEDDRARGRAARRPVRRARSVSGVTSSHSEVTPLSRSTRAASLACFGSDPVRWARMSQSPVRSGRPLVARSSTSSGVPRGLTAIPSRVRSASRSQTSVSGSPSREASGLAEHGGRGLLPVLPGVAVLGVGEAEGSLLRLELLGLVQAALDGPLVCHGANDRPRAASATTSTAMGNLSCSCWPNCRDRSGGLIWQLIIATRTASPQRRSIRVAQNSIWSGSSNFALGR